MLTTHLRLVPRLRMSVAVNMSALRFNRFSSLPSSQTSPVYDLGRRKHFNTPKRKGRTICVVVCMQKCYESYVTSLHDFGKENRKNGGPIFNRGNFFSFPQTWCPRIHLRNGQQRHSFQVQGGRAVKVTSHHRLRPMCKNEWSYLARRHAQLSEGTSLP